MTDRPDADAAASASRLPALRVLVCSDGAAAPALPADWTLSQCDGLDAAPERLAAAPVDAIVAALDARRTDRLLGAAPWQPVLHDVAALLVLHPALGDDAAALRLLAAGVQDVIGADDAAAVASLARRVRFAVARKQLERDARRAWSTDLETGLPNRAQLLEHLAQLLALRKRQPAPMALLVLCVGGLDAIAAAHGSAAAQVVRRKVAVRLRAAVRASDVVASLSGEQFALLLSTIDAPGDARRVAGKLARAMREPFGALGAPVGVRAHAGVALYPDDGDDAEPLLRHAAAAALAAARQQRGAANDPE